MIRRLRVYILSNLIDEKLNFIILSSIMLMLPRVTDAAIPEIPYFRFHNHQAFILKPTNAKSVIPWVWYAPTFAGRLPNQANYWLFERLLDNGIAIAGIDVGESYGSPAGREIYRAFYSHLAKRFSLSPKPLLLAQSRGGLMLYNWAAENADKVSGIAGIYPVGDLRSYPGLEIAAPAYGMKRNELEKQLSRHNPIERLQPLARAKVPIFHIHGDNDSAVPLEKNSKVIYDRYTNMNGRMQLVVVSGKGHEEIPNYFQSQELLKFILENVEKISE